MSTDEKQAAIAAVEKEVSPIVARAQSIADGITSPEGYKAAETYLLEVAKKRKLAVAILDPFRLLAFTAYQATLAEIKRWTDPLDQARGLVEPKAAVYVREQERIRAEEQRRLEAEQRKQIEDDRLRAAAAAEKAGDHAAADAIIDAPMAPPAVYIPPAPKTAGVAVVQRWKAEVYDIRALIKAVAAGQVSLTVLKADTSVLDALARAQKAEMKIPGVRAVPVDGMRIGGGRSAA